MVPPQAKRGKWTEDALEGAVEAVVTKRLSDYKAAAEYNIPRRTLRRYVNKNITKKQNLAANLLSVRNSTMSFASEF